MPQPLRRLLPLLTLAALGAACRDAAPPTAPPPAAAATVAPAALSPPAPDAPPAAAPPAPEAPPAAAPDDAAAHAHAGHDPAHAPIDCPLRAQGIDPHALEPFEDVAKYIAFLERPDRASWQKPDELVAALGLEGRETLFDLGAGSGYFSFRFARALPQGRVIAADPEAEMVRHLHHKAMTEGVANLEARVLSPTDPEVAPEADLVFICDVLHHVSDRPAWLAKVFARMKPGARLVLVEFKGGDLPEGPPEALKIPKADLLALAAGAGFALSRDLDAPLPYQDALIFTRP